MSLASWKAEYYPVPAHEVSAEDAVAHSLKKWRGLTKEVLNAHGLHVDCGCITSGPGAELGIDGYSCALCAQFEGETGSCRKCPLCQARGGVRCDNPLAGEEISPFKMFHLHGEPRPMIEWLEKSAALTASKGPNKKREAK